MIRQLGDLEKLPLNRYQTVMISAKRARFLNQRLKRQKEAALITPELVEPEIDESVKVTVQAVQDLIDGNIKYDANSFKTDH
ncbi:MAG: DNA-directed RNA polymerase subunit omega [candidate division Zixibacteria bacterium]|nr:DNA-directed RNA polymerase subunit omega [candidate division Zixibacteria bacterium]